MPNAHLRATHCDDVIHQFWSEVQDEVALPRSLHGADPGANPAAPSVMPAMAGRLLVAAVLVVGVTLAGQSLFRAYLAPATGASNAGSIGAFGGLRAALSGGALLDEMPTELVVYGEAQFHNFRRGITRFTDAELLQYAAATTRDMQGVSQVMTPYLLDALFLTDAEIAHRGLRRSQITASLAAQRASYQRGL
ncbi:hypothetical protein [Pararhodobacter oceanensis]|uniref:hypothetical protein n=1 Tax=Pararhodobacter oceanensis TaxID=2172121 RepID=UPI003A8CBD51